MFAIVIGWRIGRRRRGSEPVARVHLYLPDAVKERAERADLNLSEVLRRALIARLNELDAAAGSDAATSSSTAKAS